MKIHIFQSYEGDCLMVEDEVGEHRILCDGGTPKAMNDTIADQLAAWEHNGKQIDLIYISHIDRDHIGGIALLLEIMTQWKIYDYHAAKGDPPVKPDWPRPPNVAGIWNNAFRDLLKDNVGEIEELLAASAPMLQASQVEELVHLGHEYAQIATSIPEALTVSRLIKPDLLDIKLNELAYSPAHSGKLLMARKDQSTEQFGGLTLTILCPTSDELTKLRDGWDHWLRNPANRATPRLIRDQYAGELDSSAPFAASNPVSLYEWEGLAAYKDVTVPNIASTVLLVEEDGKTLLLTGDNHPDMILAGLKAAGHLDDGYIHLDVLKYPHHGSEHNTSKDFPRKVSADNYIFCGDGANTNPEISVLKAMFAARIGPENKLALAPAARDRPFQFWFSTSPEYQADGKRQTHMKAVVSWAESMEAKYPLQFKAHFSANPFVTITI